MLYQHLSVINRNFQPLPHLPNFVKIIYPLFPVRLFSVAYGRRNEQFIIVEGAGASDLSSLDEASFARMVIKNAQPIFFHKFFIKHYKNPMTEQMISYTLLCYSTTTRGQYFQKLGSVKTGLNSTSVVTGSHVRSPSLRVQSKLNTFESPF